MKRENVWSKDFTLITIGTIISAIAGQTINLPMSLMVFDETGSTLLSAFLFIAGMIPSVILPILIAPFIDRYPKKKIIVGLDYLMGLLFLLIAYIVNITGFQYSLYLLFSLITGFISTIYHLTYQAWFPDLIPVGFEQQGYAVSSSIYPTVMIVMSPVAAYLYKTFSISILFIIIGILTILAATFEVFIANIHNGQKDGKLDFKQYKADILGGFSFLKEEKGIRNIYTYMSITNGTATGLHLMVQAYFQTVSFLTVTMLAFLKSAETVGRIIGGAVQYKVDVPPKKRYGITKFVYIFYETMDIILLFIPYPFMIVNRFLCGVLGMTSATLRETSVQSYLPSNMRAKVNAVFNVFMASSIILFQILTGFLGDMIGYRKTAVILAGISLISIFIFIIVPSAENSKVYEATRAKI
ncbi:Predicted arabinose efflux permease, MFS family [Proteiniborus ethanoligenes]|uniref:Predicted arabinose efflux permease, MFS family n=1 Tax=Proteiniborus ethanoligenes TaxID=415015 RepID=A0A1H3Q9X1_9FIRM|nr:MFS transporter [Proteiniborus ethanoligenes]TAH63051.1 MAG: MFS transporter [Gottschalkiaceae bacterium]SDZ10073.1 Predicted arabinose efflux permease, MFS family [Proteiniborus ethanoligenes]